MVNSNYIKAGRLVRILRGPRQDHVGVITDIVDANRVIVENPADDRMWRHVQSLKNVEPLKFLLKIPRNACGKTVKTALETTKVLDEFRSSGKGKMLAAKKALAESTDFERYQLRVAKRSRACWTRKLFDEMDATNCISERRRVAKKLSRVHKKWEDKKMTERHNRIKKYCAARKAKKAKKGKGTKTAKK